MFPQITDDAFREPVDTAPAPGVDEPCTGHAAASEAPASPTAATTLDPGHPGDPAARPDVPVNRPSDAHEPPRPAPAEGALDVANQGGMAAVERRLEEEIRSGLWVGPIPNPAAMGALVNLQERTMSSIYARLRRRGLIDRGWLADLSAATWYVCADPFPLEVLPGDAKPIAVAAALIRRMPEWLQQGPDGRWFRRLLPRQKDIQRTCNTHIYKIERAMNLLVAVNVVEQLCAQPPLYLPRRPVDAGASHHVRFPVATEVPATPWVDGGSAVQWGPLPTSSEDEGFSSIQDREAQVREYNRSRHLQPGPTLAPTVG